MAGLGGDAVVQLGTSEGAGEPLPGRGNLPAVPQPAFGLPVGGADPGKRSPGDQCSSGCACDAAPAFSAGEALPDCRYPSGEPIFGG